MSACPDVVVIEHVPEAAVHEHGPRRRRPATETEDARFRLAPEIAHIVADDFRLAAQAACADRDAERIEHALLDAFNQRSRQRVVVEAACVCGEFLRDHGRLPGRRSIPRAPPASAMVDTCGSEYRDYVTTRGYVGWLPRTTLDSSSYTLHRARIDVAEAAELGATLTTISAMRFDRVSRVDIKSCLPYCRLPRERVNSS